MIYANAGIGTIQGSEPAPPAREYVACPTNRTHSTRMVHERHDGVTTGRMVAWCYDCNRAIPPAMPQPIAFTAAERRSVRWRKPPEPETEDTRARNAQIRLAWAKHRIPQTTLASMYGLTPQRIGQIIHGGRRRRWA